MSNSEATLVQTMSSDDIKNRIYTIRGVQVMLDSDLAVLYGVETKRINEVVKRNPKRFPPSFAFIVAADEISIIESRSQNATTIMQVKGQKGGRVYLPRVFTEQGVAMLSSVLSSDKAIDVSIAIMNAFVEMRHFVDNNAQLFQRLRDIDLKLLEHDKNFQEIFKQLNNTESLILNTTRSVMTDTSFLTGRLCITVEPPLKMPENSYSV